MEILIVVDMQNDFVSGALGTPEAGEIVPYVVGRVVEGMNRGEEILFTRDTHEANYLSTQEGKKLPVPHCIRGTEGWEIIDQLREDARHPIDKPAFASRYLGALLKARRRESYLYRPVHRYLRDLQCTAYQGVFAGGGDCGGRAVLCRRYAGEPPKRSGGHEDVPDHRRE